MEIRSIEVPAALLLNQAPPPVPDPKTATAEDFARFALALAEQVEGYRCRIAQISELVRAEKPLYKCVSPTGTIHH